MCAGVTSRRLLLQQALAEEANPADNGEPEVVGPSPTVRIMQQNTRLIVFTLEVVPDFCR